MSVETQEYINGMRQGPLTREIPECMRNKYTVVQAIIDVIMFVIVGIGYVIKATYQSIVGKHKKDLKGAVAVVTGGGGGLGSLISLRLARLGCTVVLWDINKQGQLINWYIITTHVQIIITMHVDTSSCFIYVTFLYSLA